MRMKDPRNLVSRLVFLFGIIILAGTAHGWSAIPSGSSEDHPKVSGHSIGTTSDGKTTILFGGLTGAAGSPCTDQTWELVHDSTAATMHWNLLEPTNRPRKRMYAASAVIENKIFLFGGWDPGEPGSGGEFLDDVWEFDLESKDWSELKTCKLPYPVSRHTACTMQLEDHGEAIVLHTYKGLLVFRKKNKQKGGNSDWTISPQAYRILQDDGSTIWSKNQEDGDASISPNGLSMCAMAPLDSKKLVLVGGSTKTQQLSKDIFLLDTQDWTWRKLDDVLPPLASACATRVKDGTIAVFGGAILGTQGYNGGMGLVPLNDLHLLKQVKDDKFQLTKEESFENLLPEGRVAATLSPIGKNSLLLQGGYDPITKTAFDTPWVVETKGLE